VTRGKKDTPARLDEKRTLLPTFDAEDLARELEQDAEASPTTSGFDPSAYARIVGERRLSQSGERSTPRTIPAAPAAVELPISVASPSAITNAPKGGAVSADAAAEAEDIERDIELLGRRMYGFYLASDFPSALTLAERILAIHPEHGLARLVAEQCSAPRHTTIPVLGPKSVLRPRTSDAQRQAVRLDPTSSVVLEHVDGVADAATVASLAGISDGEALERLHALLDLGLLEVVNA
jgi:hypothetical protein